MKKLYIIGAGSVGGHLAWNIEGYGEDFKIEGFFDDDPDKIGTTQFGYTVIGDVNEALKLNDADVAVGIAFPEVKRKIVEKLSSNRSLDFPSFVHQRAWVSSGVTIGKGTVIYPGTSINYGSEIGNFVVANMNCALGHHTSVGSYSSLAPGVITGGHTTIGRCVEMGIGSATVQGLNIGAGSKIGGQAMVVHDIPEGVTAVGVPAKTMKT